MDIKTVKVCTKCQVSKFKFMNTRCRHEVIIRRKNGKKDDPISMYGKEIVKILQQIGYAIPDHLKVHIGLLDEDTDE